MEFISFLLISILVLYIIRTLVRILLPMLFQSFVNNAQQHQQQTRSQNYQEGKIKVDYVPEVKKGTIPDSEGDFVDYEEIK
jgi:hypothetical protein